MLRMRLILFVFPPIFFIVSYPLSGHSSQVWQVDTLLSSYVPHVSDEGAASSAAVGYNGNLFYLDAASKLVAFQLADGIAVEENLPVVVYRPELIYAARSSDSIVHALVDTHSHFIYLRRDEMDWSASEFFPAAPDGYAHLLDFDIDPNGTPTALVKHEGKTYIATITEGIWSEVFIRDTDEHDDQLILAPGQPRRIAFSRPVYAPGSHIGHVVVATEGLPWTEKEILRWPDRNLHCFSASFLPDGEPLIAIEDPYGTEKLFARNGESYDVLIEFPIYKCAKIRQGPDGLPWITYLDEDIPTVRKPPDFLPSPIGAPPIFHGYEMTSGADRACFSEHKYESGFFESLLFWCNDETTSTSIDITPFQDTYAFTKAPDRTPVIAYTDRREETIYYRHIDGDSLIPWLEQPYPLMPDSSWKPRSLEIAFNDRGRFMSLINNGFAPLLFQEEDGQMMPRWFWCCSVFFGVIEKYFDSKVARFSTGIGNTAAALFRVDTNIWPWNPGYWPDSGLVADVIPGYGADITPLDITVMSQGGARLLHLGGNRFGLFTVTYNNGRVVAGPLDEWVKLPDEVAFSYAPAAATVGPNGQLAGVTADRLKLYLIEIFDNQVNYELVGWGGATSYTGLALTTDPIGSYHIAFSSAESAAVIEKYHGEWITEPLPDLIRNMRLELIVDSRFALHVLALSPDAQLLLHVYKTEEPPYDTGNDDSDDSTPNDNSPDDKRPLPTHDDQAEPTDGEGACCG